MPVGEATLGRVLNVVGRPVDGLGPIDIPETSHSPPGSLPGRSGHHVNVLETGVKVIDLLVPFPRGGKMGMFGGAGVGKTVIMMEMITTSPCSTAASRCLPAWVNAPVKATTFTTR
jgi:F-type H+-transporting ATPase subunit beta